jgi:hypothetical protein
MINLLLFIFRIIQMKMKAKYIILLTVQYVIISNSSFSQYNFKELQRSFTDSGFSNMPYINSSGEKGISVFEYGDDGRLAKSIWRLLDNSRSSQNYYKYDINGNIIEKYREFSDSITSTETFEYDLDKHLISEMFVRSDGFTCSEKYEYDTEGRVVKANYKNYHGWFNGYISFTYMDAGLVREGKIIEDDKEIGFINFKYDSGDRLIEEYWEFSGNYNQTFTYKYSLDEQHTVSRKP